MFGWVEDVRSLRGGTGARIAGWIDGMRALAREQAARHLGWGGAAVDARAKKLSRMVALIVHGLRTKSYEQFVLSYSNPGREPDALQRLSRRTDFAMRISPTCWYEASVCYGEGEQRSLSIVGAGDDFGVAISANAVDKRIFVDFVADYGETPGRDARAMVRVLLKLPNYRRVRTGEALLDF